MRSDDTPAPPTGFYEARAQIRAAIETCRADGLSEQAIATVLLSEVMPMLVAAYGPRGVGAVLGRVSAALETGTGPVGLRQ